MKKIISLMALLVITSLYSQNGNIVRPNTLNAKFGIGFTDLSISNYGRFNLNSLSGIVSYNHNLTTVLSIDTGLGFLNNSGNLRDDIHVSNSNIALPVTLKLNLTGKNNNTFYSGVGIMPTYKINSKIEDDVAVRHSELINEDGGNFLLGVKLGTEIEMSDKAGISIEFSYYADAFQYGYSNKQKMINYAAISVGLVRF